MVSCRVIEFLVIIIKLRRTFVLESIDKTTISNLIGPKSSPQKKKKSKKVQISFSGSLRMFHGIN